MYTITLFVGLIIVVGTIIFTTRDAPHVPKKDKNRIFIFIVAFLGIILILIGTSLMFIGLPAELNQLKKGQAYQVVAMYEKYIVVKPLSEKYPMFIKIGDNIQDPVIVGGVYIKTSNKKLEKIERMVN